MIGLSERPSRPPRENRKASPSKRRTRDPSSYRAEYGSIRLLYAAKIAAARLYASRDELDAILAALRYEERAALSALRAREQIKIQQRRKMRMGWSFAAQGAARQRRSDTPDRPRTRLRRRKRDRQFQ